jgi:spore coat polysaccharide biosynthesis protein SpsF
MKPLVVVQARTGSSRLPGKVLMPLAGAPMLARQLERISATPVAIDIVVATTTDASDEPIVALCRDLGVRCYRGHPTDLLDRHYRAALEVGAEVVVKIPSDCPLVDPGVIERVLRFFDPALHDYVSNLHPASYPDGNDVEIMTLEALAQAHREASLPLEREHTTPFLWERPERFRVGNVLWATGFDYSMSHRWTVDYREDYDFVARIYDALWSPARPIFSLVDILDLCESRPDIAAINAAYAGVNWYRHHLNELTTVDASATRLPPTEVP